jgi:endonuclease/exonuclease/phosphatase (EEP) superfamily protein YafD
MRRIERWCEAAAAAGLIAGALAPWLARFSFVLDIVANFTPPLTVVALAALLWGIIRRRWVLAAVAAAAALNGAALVLPARAARGPADPAATPVRVLAFNCEPLNPRPNEILDLIRRERVDVAVLSEMPWKLLESMPRQSAFLAEYPYVQLRPQVPTRKAHVAVISRWPLRCVGQAVPGTWNWQELMPAEELPYPIQVEVLRPASAGGPFGLVGVYALSPRGSRSWRAGNEAIDHAVRWSRQMRAGGLSVVVAGDFNSTPTGSRSRKLVGEAGLLRAKPLLEFTGTYPATLPWPISVAIDDVCVSPEVKVISWRTLDPAGSDHRPVLATLEIPGPTSGVQGPVR